MGMGAMLVTCPECRGVGHVKVDDEKPQAAAVPLDEFLAMDLSDLPRTKRSYNRKNKKVNNEREEA